LNPANKSTRTLPSAAEPDRHVPGAVALVDDDPHIAHALALWLHTLGCACSLHHTAQSLLGSMQIREGQVWVPVHVQHETLEEVRQRAPTPMAPMVAAVMDLTLADLSGFELARRLQALGLGVPLVVITAASAEELLHYGALPDGVQSLRKPFRLEALEQALRLR
jgi:CheY-like chemotaxis protein